jgi:hypothetical protein
MEKEGEKIGVKKYNKLDTPPIVILLSHKFLAELGGGRK